MEASGQTRPRLRSSPDPGPRTLELVIAFFVADELAGNQHRRGGQTESGNARGVVREADTGGWKLHPGNSADAVDAARALVFATREVVDAGLSYAHATAGKIADGFETGEGRLAASLDLFARIAVAARRRLSRSGFGRAPNTGGGERGNAQPAQRGAPIAPLAESARQRIESFVIHEIAPQHVLMFPSRKLERAGFVIRFTCPRSGKQRSLWSASKAGHDT